MRGGYPQQATAPRGEHESKHDEVLDGERQRGGLRQARP